MMSAEEKYREIGKAVINECMERGSEIAITVTLRAVQFNGKLYIRMEDAVDPISIWDCGDSMAISGANRNQRAREQAEALEIKTKGAKPQPLPARVVIVK